MSKSKRKSKVNSYSSDSDEMVRMFKVLGVVVLALALFYIIFAVITGEISFGNNDTKTPDEIQNVEILAGTTFSRADSEYYVLFYDFSASDSIRYANIYDMYQNSGAGVKVYLVDLGKKFNTKYITKNNKEIDISSSLALKVINGTLVKVEDGKGVSYSAGTKEIEKTLFNK